MNIQSLINSISQKLIDAECYNIPKDENGNFIVDEKYCVLYKTGFESSCIIEVFDSSFFTEEDVTRAFENAPEQAGDIGLINTENTYHIKIFIIKELSNVLIEHIEEYHSKLAGNNAVLVLSLESKSTVLNRGIVHPYENICIVLTGCMKADQDIGTNSRPDFGQLMEQRFIDPVSEFKDEFITAPINNYVSLFLAMIFLIATTGTTILSVLSGSIDEILNLLLFIILFGVPVFTFFIIGEKIEGNLGTKKYLLVLLGGFLPSLFLFNPISAVINLSFAPYGSLVYVWWRIPGLLKERKLISCCFYANIVPAVIFAIKSGFEFIFSFLLSMLFGFLIPGCINFDLEVVKPRIRKSFFIYTIGMSSVYILLFFIIN